MATDKALAYLQQAQANLANAQAELQAPAPPAPPASNVVHVKAGDNLQAAVDAAAPGTMLLVDPRGSYSGLTLRKKATSATAPITIAPDTNNLANGQRVGPAALADLIKVGGTAPLSGIYTVDAEPGAAFYLLRGFAPSQGNAAYAVTYFGDDQAADPGVLPHNIVLDQWLINQDPAKGAKRGIGMNCRSVTIQNSHVAGIFHTDDAQAAGGWNGSIDITIVNNYLESSGENIMFGGSDAASAAALPQRLTVRGNYLTKPIAWRQMKTGITVKNTFELKAMLTALVEQNVIENSWADGQTGFLVLFTTRNQNGNAPYAQVADITFRDNVIRHGAAFVQILGLDNHNPSQRLSRLKILNNLVYDIDPKKWNDPKTGNWGAGRIIQISAGPQDVEIGHNTVLGSDPNTNPNINSAVTIGTSGDTYKAERLNIHDNIFPEGDYGIAGDNTPIGRPSLDAFAIGAVFTNNLIIRGGSGRTVNYGPQPNFISDAGTRPIDPATLKPTATFLAAAQTTDGKPVGCDVDALRAKIPGLDLTK